MQHTAETHAIRRQAIIVCTELGRTVEKIRQGHGVFRVYEGENLDAWLDTHTDTVQVYIRALNGVCVFHANCEQVLTHRDGRAWRHELLVAAEQAERNLRVRQRALQRRRQEIHKELFSPVEEVPA